jgi:hypothetical protein
VVKTISIYSTRWNSCLAPELCGLSWLDENLSRGANTGFWLDETAAYTFVRETTILPRTVVPRLAGQSLWLKRFSRHGQSISLRANPEQVLIPENSILPSSASFLISGTSWSNSSEIEKNFQFGSYKWQFGLSRNNETALASNFATFRAHDFSKVSHIIILTILCFLRSCKCSNWSNNSSSFPWHVCKVLLRK